MPELTHTSHVANLGNVIPQDREGWREGAKCEDYQRAVDINKWRKVSNA